MAISKIIEEKFRTLFQQGKTPQDIKALEIIFAFYEDQIDFLKQELEREINQSVELKVKEVEMHQSYKNIISKTDNVLSGKEGEEIQALRKQNKQLKVLIQYERQQFKQKEIEHQKALAQFKQIFFKDFNELLHQEREEESKKRQIIVKDLQQNLKKSEQKQKYIIDEVNTILEINIKGSEDIEQWMKIFKKEAEHYKQEIQKYMNNQIHKKPKSQISKIAEIQKQKMASRRIYLLKTVMNK